MDETLNILIKTVGESPGLKAKKLKSITQLDKKLINRILHEEKKIFEQDDDFAWHLIAQDEVTLQLNGGWITAEIFEKCLTTSGCLLNNPASAITIVFPENCQIMMDAGARLLSLANQLADSDKTVSFDFTESPQVLHYLNRNGFLGTLSESIIILPKKPKSSKAKIYKGNNSGLMEHRPIQLDDYDENIPKDLTEIFINHAGSDFENDIFTIYAELTKNICMHSDTKIDGFASVQVYQKKQRIQTVISDSGVGISHKLLEAIPIHYPELLQEYDDLESIDTAIELTIKAFEQGKLSSLGSDPDSGHGLGLFLSRKMGAKHNATIKIRQEYFIITLRYYNGKPLKPKILKDIPRILGTHICFDFQYD